MPKVIALYRYPVKGFTPEVCKQLTILPGGRVAGDRVLHFRFADAPVADDEWCRKYHGVVLANTPGLARLHVRYDAHACRLRMEAGAHGGGSAWRRERTCWRTKRSTLLGVRDWWER